MTSPKDPKQCPSCKSFDPNFRNPCQRTSHDLLMTPCPDPFHDTPPISSSRLGDEAQVKHMVDRFLAWKLPDDFQPDAGISFNPTYKGWNGAEMKLQPVGTNLFTATQAEAMIRYLLDEAQDTQALPSAKASTSNDLHVATKSPLDSEGELDWENIYDDFESMDSGEFIKSMKALIHRREQQAAYQALRQHEGVYTDEITKAEVYRALVKQIKPYEQHRTKQ